MPPVTIENPILNSPFREPNRHFRFTDDGITDEIIENRRISTYFMPIPRPRKRGGQMEIDSDWLESRVEENVLINQIRARVNLWRKTNYTGVTPVTRQLLAHWSDPDRDRKLFFCQIEALETAIYLAEVATKGSDSWIESDLKKANAASNPGLFRIAIKMATGTGKTVVMAMLIAWQTLNKVANRADKRFSDTFLVVTPGITIRDRLQVLQPNDSANYYRFLNLVPDDLRQQLLHANIVITNFHAFKLRESGEASKLTKAILTQGAPSPFIETPNQMVARVCRELGNKRDIIIFNDEAHHCYRRKPEDPGAEPAERLKGDDRKDAEQREEEARIWISGLAYIRKKLGVRTIYDLSATPFFLRGSGYSEGTLFPWVVSDFSLIDAIEAGIVKIPRVPVADNSMTGDQPTYRNLWLKIREHLPKKSADKYVGEPHLPKELEGALHSLYGDYHLAYERWKRDFDPTRGSQTPPVFIVVCNNTTVSKLVFDFIAGWEVPGANHPDGSPYVSPGRLSLFSNVSDNHWTARPSTILVDSAQLESGESMSLEFRKAATAEIDEFKAEYRIRYPGRDPDDLTPEDLLREVMNTVGKPGKLGEQIKCVVSVSMLTEGWDANTVTHILGVRAFGTQLLCEQVVGRGLRRVSYSTDDNGHFYPEYAEVYGIPFSFIPTSGSSPNSKPGPIPTRVRALSERAHLAITFPRLTGYRWDLPEGRLEARFTKNSRMTLTTEHLATWTENAPIVGESSHHNLDEVRLLRKQTVAFKIASLILDKFYRDNANQKKFWLFPQLLEISRRWIDECVDRQDDTFIQMLAITELALDASERVYAAIVGSEAGQETLRPLLQPYDTLGSTNYIDFDTTRPVFRTAEDRCHISHVVADTDSWEQKTAQALEDMPEVISYVKNHNLGFKIPYSDLGEAHNYIPDFVVHINDGSPDPLQLIIEITGQRKREKGVKVETAQTFWVPAVNNHGGFGKWAFLEIDEPWNVKAIIREFITGPSFVLKEIA